MSPRPNQIAFVGLGRMGLPMCARLTAASFEVVATDLRPELQAAAQELGAQWAPTIAGACAEAEFVITMLPGPGEVGSATEEIVAALAPGACWIDMSTASPAIGRQITAAAGRRGVVTLDAPVGGGPEAAREGRLVAIAGGDAGDLRRCRPLLDRLAQRVLHVGPAGSGYAVKLLINLLWFEQAVATAEALTLARRMQLDLEVVREALMQSAAASGFIAHDVPALLDGDDLTTFPLARCCEELESVRAIGRELEVPLELAAAVSELHLRALERYGDVDGELLGARLVAERAGVQLRREPGTGQ